MVFICNSDLSDNLYFMNNNHISVSRSNNSNNNGTMARNETYNSQQYQNSGSHRRLGVTQNSVLFCNGNSQVVGTGHAKKLLDITTKKDVACL